MKKIFAFFIGLFSIFIHAASTTPVIQNASTSTPTVASSSLSQQSSLQTSINSIQCGSINQKILTQYNYQPTETEKEATIKSLTCINQALIRCSPSVLVLENGNEVTSVTVEGQEKSGCNVAVKEYNGETMMCPLPPSYVVGLQKKFAANSYDATIVTGLVGDITAEIESGNKTSNCSVSN